MDIITEIDLLKYRRTRIVATLGPASDNPAVIRRLIQAGVNMVRLNMSHGDHATHTALYECVRDAAAELGEPIAVLADLCGPKIRTGRFQTGSIDLVAGDSVTVTTRDIVGEHGLIPSQYEAIANDVKPGDRVLLDDGAMQLRVEKIEETEVRCVVVDGGTLKDHKGINLPGVDVSAPSLTEKDRVDAKFAVGLGVHFLALSFVRRARDVLELRELVTAAGGAPALVAKIEKPEALDNYLEILDAADAIMVARGDLGVELNPEQVPVAQNQLINYARANNKPVIVATQMLESMINSPRPTRAEVTDVSHAVSMSTDAVMLSGETAAGSYPVQAVEMMTRVARQTESFLWHEKHLDTVASAMPVTEETMRYGDAIADATAQLAFALKARAVLVISQAGMSAVTVSAARPTAPIVGITSDPATCRRMNLMWGVIPVLADDAERTNPNQIARRTARDLGLAEADDFILLVRGFSGDPEFNTPSITALQMTDDQ